MKNIIFILTFITLAGLAFADVIKPGSDGDKIDAVSSKIEKIIEKDRAARADWLINGTPTPEQTATPLPGSTVTPTPTPTPQN